MTLISMMAEPTLAAQWYYGGAYSDSSCNALCSGYTGYAWADCAPNTAPYYGSY
ncbi:9907_t:CDS:1, partial [Acaulospora colombiana]